jgi:hypothetical protein
VWRMQMDRWCALGARAAALLPLSPSLSGTL